MKIKILIAFLVLAFLTKAQTPITITSADMANLNDTVRFSTSAVDVSAMLNDTGANRTWNFSNLVPNFQDIVSFKSALSANILYSSFSSSSYGTQAPDISFTLASATNVYNFYTKSSASYVADGRAFTVSGLPGLQTYTGKDIIYRFPMTYGNRDTNSYTSNSVSLLVANLTSSGKRINVVDGWGTLTTPYGTFNCIRVKSVVQETDSVQITTPITFSLPVAHNTTEYKWFTNGKKIPILEVDVTTGTGAATTVKYRDSARASAFNGLANFKANKTTFAANASDVCTLINTSLNSPTSCTWTITPSTYTITSGSLTYDTLKIYFTAPGLYTVKLHSVYNAGTSDTTRVNYIMAGSGPTANFSSSISGSINPVTPVYFYDSSSGIPNIISWKWTFAPNKVSFVGGTSSTSKNPIITFDSATNYAVTLKVTDSIGSNSITKNYGVTYAGVNNLNLLQQSVSIFPNPAKNIFGIESSNLGIKNIELFDITGKLIAVKINHDTDKSINADCSQLNSGVYFVKIYFKDNSIVTKRISISN